MGTETTTARYCSNCGTGLTTSMNFCPHCGKAIEMEPSGSHNQSSQGADHDHHDTSVADHTALDEQISRALEAGWELEHKSGDRAVVVRRSFGSGILHLLIALLTLWWTSGAGNALYAAYAYFVTPDRAVLRGDGTTRVAADGSIIDDSVSDTSIPDTATASIGAAIATAITAGGLWLVSAVLIGLGLWAPSAGVSVGLVLAGFAFVVLGLSILPPIRRRLAERHSVFDNGRIRSVDERVVTAANEPCAACFGPVGRGIKRTYRTEFLLLGFPLRRQEHHNRYCRSCANAENPSLENWSEDKQRERSVESASR